MNSRLGFLLSVASAVAKASAAGPNVTVDQLLPTNLSASIDAQVGASVPALQYVDVSALAYSTTPLRPSRRSVTAVSIVWGAGNSHGTKTLEDAVALVDDAHQVWSDMDILLFPECFL